MASWPIERVWSVRTAANLRDEAATARPCTTVELKDFRVCIMLGAAGLGKTVEQNRLAEMLRHDGVVVHQDRFSAIGDDPRALAASLRDLVTREPTAEAIVLDALDEVFFSPAEGLPLRLHNLIVSTLASARPRLYITCRSTEWRPKLADTLADAYGSTEVAVAALQPLSPVDVGIVATSCGLDANAFWSAVQAAGCERLAGQPLILHMLLAMFHEQRELPRRRCDIFERAMLTLATESEERRSDGTATTDSVSRILEAAELMAVLCLLNGKDGIEGGAWPHRHMLHETDVERLPHIGDRLGAGIRAAVARSGLCKPTGHTGFRFVHRQYAEYLAGRRLAQLPFHQVRTILRSHDPLTRGVAGPLREAASFAAEVAGSGQLVDWLVATDPEVIGLARLNDPTIRRDAVLGLFGQFDFRKLVDFQARPDTLPLEGLHYPEASRDLQPILERQSGHDDIMEFAVQLVHVWHLDDLSDSLAALVLNPTAPYGCRKSAGYVLADIGTAAARRSLLSLTGDNDETDPLRDLKGLALRCNWPHSLSTSELLDRLTVPPDQSYCGSYQEFLDTLDRALFDSSDDRDAGLEWATEMVHANCSSSSIRNLVARIARQALGQLPNPDTAARLAALLVAASHNRVWFPLNDPEGPLTSPSAGMTQNAPLASCSTAQRHALIEALCHCEPDQHDIWLITRTTDGLVMASDFHWLLDQAKSPDLSLTIRTNFAIFANACDWWTDPVLRAAAYEVRDIEPLASNLRFPIGTALRSQRATALRAAHSTTSQQHLASRPTPPAPPPPRRGRLLENLQLVEAGAAKAFVQLTLELAPNADLPAVRLTTTPGWLEGDESLRSRILEAARQFVALPSAEADKALASPLNQILDRSLAALLLLVEQDVDWLDNQPAWWWAGWTGYILRELRPRLSADSGERLLKQQLFSLLHTHAPASIREHLKQLWRQLDPAALRSCEDLLGLLTDVSDAELDQELCLAIREGTLPTDRRRVIAHAALKRAPALAIKACTSALADAAASRNTQTYGHLASVLLLAQPEQGWPPVRDLLRRFEYITEPVLRQLARDHDRREAGRAREDDGPFARLPEGHLLDLFKALFDLTPPFRYTTRPSADYVAPRYSVKHFRARLLDTLSARNTSEAIEAIRELRLWQAPSHPWLLRATTIATRGYRRTPFVASPIEAIDDLLNCSSKSTHFIRSGTDVLDNIVLALKIHGQLLQQEYSNEKSDYWNTPQDAEATCKDKQQASDKLRDVINRHFKDNCIALTRDPKLYRRISSVAKSREPGCDVGILVNIPAAGTLMGRPLCIPIAVKLSDNPDAISDLVGHLRSMTQLGTQLGVFVVVWLGPSSSGLSHSSLGWEFSTNASSALWSEMASLAPTVTEGRDVRTVVINVSLPQPTTKPNPHTKTQTKSRRLKKSTSGRAKRTQAKAKAQPRPTKRSTKTLKKSNDGPTQHSRPNPKPGKRKKKTG